MGELKSIKFRLWGEIGHAMIMIQNNTGAEQQQEENNTKTMTVGCFLSRKWFLIPLFFLKQR